MNLQLGTTWNQIRRSPYSALAAVMIMVLTFFVTLVLSLVSLGSDRVLSYLEKKPEISVFFNDTITSEEQILDLKEEILDSGKAVNVRFVSKAEALAIYQEKFKDSPILLELVTEKTLPASLEFGATNVSALPELYDLVKDYPNVEDISYLKDVVSDLIRVVDSIRKFGLGLVAFLLVVSLLIVLTVVGMKIALRKEQIEIERLIGASNWYIRWPFILEGMFYGTTGATLAWAVVFIGIFLLTPNLSPYFAGVGVLPLPASFVLIVLGAAFFSGLLVGVMGSLIAVWRYLRP